jgi:hypothetical protein
VAIARPHAPPKNKRAVIPRGAVRAGVFGSLSAINSATASTVKTINVERWLTKANLVPSKCNQPKHAAQHTSAGGVSDRRPSTQPRRNASKNVIIVAVRKLLLSREIRSLNLKPKA